MIEKLNIKATQIKAEFMQLHGEAKELVRMLQETTPQNTQSVALAATLAIDNIQGFGDEGVRQVENTFRDMEDKFSCVKALVANVLNAFNGIIAAANLLKNERNEKNEISIKCIENLEILQADMRSMLQLFKGFEEICVELKYL